MVTVQVIVHWIMRLIPLMKILQLFWYWDMMYIPDLWELLLILMSNMTEQSKKFYLFLMKLLIAFICRYDTPLLSPTSFDSSNSVKKVVKSLDEAYHLHPGDDLILRCHHSTLGKVLPIFGGVASYDELCFAILTHHCPDRQYCPMNTLTSCMSRPTDENIAKALNFKLNYYETHYYEEAKPTSNRRY